MFTPHLPAYLKIAAETRVPGEEEADWGVEAGAGGPRPCVLIGPWDPGTGRQVGDGARERGCGSSVPMFEP